ncbi:hypothetical protein GGTG_05709 [Gaeumannomyces tritici R3-111a-1]|uniref:Uncharacterized protein n=1 Tax=Gaeumannomyces tritici (strain R3-111a-1) TaxID=644352 RepID=J3NWP7_GAET3|nr:hypothetical protein GGTG_05709 [Gaeumannomyces tritici R3-111a-1]EJT75779.1 hypothetical protein GGTG_05709 [Gaeumannomyces tritici R3-111a-1]
MLAPSFGSSAVASGCVLMRSDTHGGRIEWVPRVPSGTGLRPEKQARWVPDMARMVPGILNTIPEDRTWK